MLRVWHVSIAANRFRVHLKFQHTIGLPSSLDMRSCFRVSSNNPSFIERKERFARKMAGKAKPVVRSANRLPPGQHLTTGFPVLDLGIKPEVPLDKWQLEIGGLVENPISLSW